MWLKRKPKNRRFEREQVLDVKLRLQHRRALRMRLLTATLAFLFGASLTLFLFWRGSEWFLNELVFKNAAFSIHAIEVQTDGIIPTHLIRAWAGVKEGDNLFSVDLLRVRRDLELQPLIQTAALERVLPRTLKIRVVEREPIAQIPAFQPTSAAGDLQATLFYIDEGGYVMLPLDASGRAESVSPVWDPLAVLTGIAGTELRPGKRVDSPQMHAALRFISLFGRSPMAGMVDLKAVDLSAPQVLTVTTRQGNEITFALDGLARQIVRWRTVHDYAQQENKSIATLDLSVSNNVPARWQQASAAPPPQPKPLKPSRYRKRHV